MFKYTYIYVGFLNINIIGYMHQLITSCLPDLGQLKIVSGMYQSMFSVALRHQLPLQVGQLWLITGVRILGWQRKRGYTSLSIIKIDSQGIFYFRFGHNLFIL